MHFFTNSSKPGEQVWEAETKPQIPLAIVLWLGERMGVQREKKNTCNPACRVVLHAFFTRDFPFHALKYWSNTGFFLRGLNCGVDVYKLSWLRWAKSSVLKPAYRWCTLSVFGFLKNLSCRWNEKEKKKRVNNWASSSCSVRVAEWLCSGSSPVVWPLTVMLNCLWEEGFFSASPFIANASSQPFPLFQPMPHFATQALVLFAAAPLNPPPPTPSPLPLPCVTGFFLITDPSSCYYSNPLLYNMPFYMRFDKGPIWSEGYGARSWEMQLHGGNLCLGQNGGLTSSLLMHSLGHSGPSLTCWAHWIR